MGKKGEILGAVIGLASLVLTPSVLAQTVVSFGGVGKLSRDATSGAYSVSRDGEVVAAESLDGAGLPEAFAYVTSTGERISIGMPAGWTTTTGRGIDRDPAGNWYMTGDGKNIFGNSQAYFYDRSLATPAFTEIPPLGGSVNYGRAIRCSGGDVYVVGQSTRNSPLRDHAFRWRKNGASLLDLGDTETPKSPTEGSKGNAECIGVRPNGAMVIRGTGETGWVSGSGAVAFSWYSSESLNYCYYWTVLEPYATGQILRSHARGSSADGRYTVGSSTFAGSPKEWYRQAYLYDVDDSDLDKTCDPANYKSIQHAVAPPTCTWGSRMLGYLPGHTASEAYGVSGNGGLVVGSSALIQDEIRAGGNMISDTVAVGDDVQVVPVGTNTGDRNAVVVRPGPNGVLDSAKHPDDSLSYFWPEGSSFAFIWDATNGMRNLKTVLEGHGLDLAGWVLTEARSISEDGTVICGLGLHNGQAEGWVATIGRPGAIGACCMADTTCTESSLPDCEGEFHAGGTCATTACCPKPFADSDLDGDIDMMDFADFQRCVNIGLNAPSIPLDCKCWDQDDSGIIDDDDFTRAFVVCGSGPEIDADPLCR